VCTHVEITAILVAKTAIAVVTISAGSSVSAFLETRTLARVRSVGGGDGVGLPDIHLRAASTDLTLSCVRVRIRGVPAFNIGFAVDELDVVGTLRITVTSSVLGTGLVVALSNTTIGGHLDEVESAVETTGQLRDIDVEGELLTDEVEHLVLCVALHKVCTRTNVGGVRALGDEFDAQRIAAGSDTVGT
jgi:hypothetical protein